MSAEDVVTRMFSTDYKRYDFFTGTKSWDYKKDIIGGIEIETCVREGFFIYDDGWEEDFYPYEETVDESIKCSKGESVEFITQDPYPIVDILDPGTEIGNATERIMNSEDVYACAENSSGRVSCGTHVHMSNTRLTMLKYPHFDKVMRYFWIQYYQPYCLQRFYKFQDRDKNIFYSQISNEIPQGKYEMFNVLPSFKGLPSDKIEMATVISLLPKRTWHFEFRGYGEMRTGWTDENPIAKEYIQVLMNMWYEAEDYYTKHNIADADMVRIISGVPKSQPVIHTIERMLDKPHGRYYKLKHETMETHEYLSPEIHFKKVDYYGKDSFQLFLTHELPNFDFNDYDMKDIVPFTEDIKAFRSLPNGFYLLVYNNVEMEGNLPDVATDIEQIIQDEFTDIDIIWKIVQRDTMVFQIHFGYSRFGYARPRNRKRKRRVQLKF
jgi:hypothetical protein